MEFTIQDVIFQIGNVTVAFVHDFKNTGWPGLVVQISADGLKQTVQAPLTVTHAVQMCSFNFTSLVKKIDEQDITIQQLREKLQLPDQDAEVLPFKPRIT